MTNIFYRHIDYGQCHRCLRPAAILRTRKTTRRDGSESVTLTTICVQHAPKDIVRAFGIATGKDKAFAD